MARTPPKMDSVTLPHAVALVAPPLDEISVRNVIAAALCEARLVEIPVPSISRADAARFLDYDKSILPLVSKWLEPRSSSPEAWQLWFGLKAIDWTSGFVRVSRSAYQPIFKPAGILNLFPEEPSRGNAKGRQINVAPADLRAFLEVTADGSLAEDELKKLAETHFEDRTIPARIWRDAWTKLALAKKRRRGDTDRALRARRPAS